MLRNFIIALSVLALCSFVLMPKTGEEKGVYANPELTGQKIQSTLFGEFVKQSFTGKQMLMVVQYSCDHCVDATKDAQKLADEKLIDEIFILGSESGEPGSKEKFMKETGHNYKSSDYDFQTLADKLMAADSLFPNPPIGIYIKDDIIKKIYTEIPGVNSFEKYNK